MILYSHHRTTTAGNTIKAEGGLAPPIGPTGGQSAKRPCSPCRLRWNGRNDARCGIASDDGDWVIGEWRKSEMIGDTEDGRYLVVRRTMRASLCQRNLKHTRMLCNDWISTCKSECEAFLHYELGKSRENIT